MAPTLSPSQSLLSFFSSAYMGDTNPLPLLRFPQQESEPSIPPSDYPAPQSSQALVLSSLLSCVNTAIFHVVYEVVRHLTNP